MISRILIIIAVIALCTLLIFNSLPLFWSPNPNNYIQQDEIKGMAIEFNEKLFTLNFEQQKKICDILNRAIPVGDIEKKRAKKEVVFSKIVIYRFDNSAINIKPIAWVDTDLLFSAPEWSKSYLLELSQGELLDILSKSYDKKRYTSP